MKKILVLVLALCMVVSLAARGGSKPAETKQTTLKLWCIATESDAVHVYLPEQEDSGGLYRRGGQGLSPLNPEIQCDDPII